MNTLSIMNKYTLYYYKPLPGKRGSFYLVSDKSYSHLNNHLINRCEFLLRITSCKSVFIKTPAGKYFDYEVWKLFGVEDYYEFDDIKTFENQLHQGRR